VILDAIGIHMHSLKVAGGIILSVRCADAFRKNGMRKRKERQRRGDLAVFPLAVPSIAGPAAMMAVIVLTDNDVYTVPQRIETGVFLLVVLFITYFCCSFRCDSAGDRSTGRVRPRPCEWTDPLLSGGGIV